MMLQLVSLQKGRESFSVTYTSKKDTNNFEVPAAIWQHCDSCIVGRQPGSQEVH